MVFLLSSHLRSRLIKFAREEEFGVDLSDGFVKGSMDKPNRKTSAPMLSGKFKSSDGKFLNSVDIDQLCTRDDSIVY